MQRLMNKTGLRIIILAAILLLMAAGGINTAAAAEEKDGKNGDERTFVVDLSKGFTEYDGRYSKEQDEAFQTTMSLKNVIYSDKIYGKNAVKMDLDGDGTFDVMTFGLDYPTDSEGGPSRWIYIPSAECSVRGTYTCVIGENPYNNSYNYFMEYGYLKNYDSVTFILPEEPVRSTYEISIENGKAYKNGVEVTSAAPGDEITIIPEAVVGKYVFLWKSELIGEYIHHTIGYAVNSPTSFFMPAADVSLKTVMVDQAPLTFDLTKGYYLVNKDFEKDPNILDLDLPFENDAILQGMTDNEKVDLDGDGTADICCYIIRGNHPMESPFICRFYIIPLSSSNIRGTYTMMGRSACSYWPYTFIFPSEPIQDKYKITVNGGVAKNGNWNTVTEASPGERITLLSDDGIVSEGFVSSPEYENTTDEMFRGYVEVKHDNEIIMPACDITYTVQGKSVKTLVLSFSPSSDGAYLAADFPEDIVKEGLSKDVFWGDFYIYKAFEAYDCELDGNTVRMKTISPYHNTSVDQMAVSFEYYVPEYTVETKENRYDSITFIFYGKQTLYKISCSEKNAGIAMEAIGTIFETVVKSAPDQMILVDGSRIIAPDGYRLDGFRANGISFSPLAYLENVWSFYMPDHDVWIEPVYTKLGESDNGEATPTPTPDAGPVTGDPAPTVTGTPIPVSPEPTAEASEPSVSNNGNKEKKEDGFNWFYILIPIVVLSFACMAFSLIMRRRKQNSDGKKGKMR